MALETVLVYLAVFAVFTAMLPGLRQAFCLSKSSQHDEPLNVPCVAGLNSKDLHKVAAGVAVTAVLTTSLHALLWITWLGGAYLVWFGLRLMLGTQFRDGDDDGSCRLHPWFRRGVMPSLAWPLAGVFLSALCLQIVDPAAALVPQLVILGVSFLAAAFVSFIDRGRIVVHAALALKRFTLGDTTSVWAAARVLRASTKHIAFETTRGRAAARFWQKRGLRCFASENSKGCHIARDLEALVCASQRPAVQSIARLRGDEIGTGVP